MFQTCRNVLITPLIVILSVLSLGCSDGDEAQSPAQAAAKVAVEVIEIQPQSVLLKTELPARTSAIRMAEVRPQVDGIIDQRLFTEGAKVQAGEQLYQIEPDRYQAAVANARATLQRTKADLKISTTREQRYKALVDDNAVSQEEYDEALAAFEQAKAEVAVSEAALDSALINLRYTKVNAPIDGQIGISHVTEGALVNAAQTNSMATIHQLDPIYVDISQASKDILKLRRKLIDGEINGEDTPVVRLKLEDGSEYAHQGELQFSEVNVNQNTGSILMRARFPNPENLLLPGMYVRAEVREGRINDALLVPQKAVTFDREGAASVFIVNDQQKIEKRTVVIPRSIGHQWLVESGLASQEKVVVVGLQKISAGSDVEIVNSEMASPNED